MPHRKVLLVILLLVSLLALPSCSQVSEKDIIGKWESTKLSNLWMEFFPDMTCTGGKWSVSSDGTVKVINPDGAVRTGKLQDGTLIFAEFGDKGIFVKAGK